MDASEVCFPFWAKAPLDCIALQSMTHLQRIDGGFELLDLVDESVVDAVDAQFHVGMISAILQTRLGHLSAESRR